MLTQLKKTHLPSLQRHGLAVEHFPAYVNRKLRLHSVDVVLVSFITRGKGKHIIGNEVFMENGSSLAVTHYGQQHDILTDHRGMDVINLYLDLQNYPLPALPQEFEQVLPLLLPLHPKFLNRLNRIVRLDFEDPKPVADLLFALRRELDGNAPGSAEAVNLLVKLFLIFCCRRAIENGLIASEAVEQTPPALEQLRSFLDHNYAGQHTLGSLAKQARCSRTYLCRAFKAYTGKRVFDYLIERRLQAAMLRLRGGNEKVLAIALDCGFNDLSYFNRKFKQLVGMTPTQMRAQMRLSLLRMSSVQTSPD